MDCSVVYDFSKWWCAVNHDSQSQAAWVQAIGSILAILAILALRAHELSEKKRENKKIAMGAAAKLMMASQKQLMTYKKNGAVPDRDFPSLAEINDDFKQAIEESTISSQYFGDKVNKSIVSMSLTIFIRDEIIREMGDTERLSEEKLGITRLSRKINKFNSCVVGDIQSLILTLEQQLPPQQLERIKFYREST